LFWNLSNNEGLTLIYMDETDCKNRQRQEQRRIQGSFTPFRMTMQNNNGKQSRLRFSDRFLGVYD
jgi:hypothetical protein